MLRATYRLNLFGGKNAMPKPPSGRDFVAKVLGWDHLLGADLVVEGRPPMGGGPGGF